MKKQSKKLLSILLSVMMLVGFVPLAALPVANAADVWDGTWDGSGFSNNHITSAKGLAQFINNAGTGTSYSGQTVYLDVDIDLNGIDFGNISGGKNVYYSRDNYFQGTFDGQGHTIANFQMHNSDHRIGLFRSARNATFKNVTFTNAFIDDNDNNKKNGFAVVVGFGEGNLTFDNVHIASGTVYGYNYVGGLVGEYGANETLRFTNCSNGATIHADNERAAGLVGHSKGSVVASGCSNTGEIYAAYSDAGGIAGWIEDDESSFVNCSNTGKVSTDACAGGIVGYYGSKSQDKKMTLTGCSNTGYIESRAKTAGGIAGMMDTDAEHSIENNVNRGSVYGREDAGGIVGSNIGAGIWRNDKNYGEVRCDNDNAAGICGDVEDDVQKFYNCYNTGSVEGKNSIGGVLGYGQNANHEFYDCGNSGAITSTSDAAGGIFGYGNESEPTIEQCWNVGSVNAYNDAGGILGHTAHHSYIRRCFNAGAIGTYNHNENGAHGGIAGQTSDKSGSSNDNPNMTDCVNWGAVSGGRDDGGLIGKIKDGRTPYYITNSYNAGSVTGTRPFAIIAYGGNVGNNVYYDNGKTMGTVQGNSISDNDLRNSSGFSGNYCKNTWGVKIGSTTYYYPILTWYRDLFVFNLKFVDSPSGTNAYFDGNYGAGFTSPNPSRTGYTCGDWYDENNANRKMAKNTLIWCGTSAPTDTMTVTQHFDEVTQINNETTFRLTWTPNPYTIHFNGNGSSYGMMEDFPMVYDTAKNLPAVGYFREYTVTYNYNGSGKANTSDIARATFNGWARSADGAKEFNDQQSVNNLTAELNGTVELYAKWTLNSVTLPTPTREGYDFGGWYGETGCATKIGDGGASYTPTANKTLFAKWTPVEYTVTYDGNGATSGSTADSTHVYDTAKNLTENGFERKYTVTYHYNAPGKDDTSDTAEAAFNGWAESASGAKVYDDGQSVINLRNTAGAFPLFADWTVSSVTLPKPARDGYQFGGWYGEAALTSFVGNGEDSYTPAADKELFARWEANPYKVHFNGNGATSGEMADQDFTFDARQALTENAFKKEYTVSFNHKGGAGDASAAAEAAFKGWAVSENGSVVYWNKEEVSNLTAVNNGTADLWAVWDPMGNVKLPVSAKEGCTFEGWFADAELTDKVGDAGDSYVPASDGVTLYAKHTTNTYQITFLAADGTTVLDKQTVNYNELPVAPSIPEKTPTATQHFTGAWDKTVVPATETAAYTVVYTGVDHFGGSETCLDKAVCDECGTAYGELGDHALTEIPAEAPSCLAPGHVAYWHCGVCGKDFTDATGAEEISAYQNSHTWDEGEITTPATCKEEGVKTFTCTVCGATREDSVDIDPANHAGYGTEVKNDKAATCKEDGYTGDTVCKGCGATLAAGTVIDKSTVEHTWDEGEITTAPTCKDEGVKTFTCAVCETTRTEPVAVDPDNHAGYGTEVKNDKAATCKEDGYTGDTVCKGCGATLVSGTVIDKSTVDHTWDEGEVTTAATCKEAGVKTFTCAVCEATRTEPVAVDPANHADYGTELKNDKAATCKEDGYTGDTVCKGCGATLAEGTVIDKSTVDHTWDQGEVTTAATCKEAGVKTFTCAVCEATRTEPVAVDPANHADYGMEVKNDKAATCKEDGYTGDTVCKGCGATLVSGTVIDKSTVDHTWDQGEVTTAATCKAEGVKTFTCTVCETTRTEPVAVDPDNHADYGTEVKNDKAATCKEDGYTGDTVCKGCGATLAEGTVIDKATVSHTWDEGTVTTAATCKAEGVKTFTCAVCEATRTEPVAVDPANHADYGTEVKNDKAATCKEDGYTGDTVCKGCGATLAEGTMIDKSTVDHTWDQGEVTTAATCKTEGVKTFTCTVCGTTREDPVAVDPDNHAGGTKTESRNATGATCVTPGSYDSVVVCLGCGHDLSITHMEGVTDPNTHEGATETKEENIVPGTCNAERTWNEVVYCLSCGQVISTTPKTGEKDPANHAGGTEVRGAVTATCTVEGYTGDTWCLGCETMIEEGGTTGFGAHQAEYTEAVPATCKDAGFAAYWYCPVCGNYYLEETMTDPLTRAQLDEQGKVDKLTVHTPGAAHQENPVDATCTREGSYDEVVRCTVCNLVLESAHRTVDKLAHTPGDAVKENEVPASCDADGGYDLVVRCTVCGEAITSTHQTVPAGHTAGEPVRENENAPTCTEAGSYDAVVYCTQCGEEISRETVAVPAKGHTWGEWQVVTPATEETDGEAKRVCSVCGETETKVIEASGEEVTRLVKFVNINKMHYLIDLGDGETYAVYNSSTIQWISDKPLRFSVVTYSGFNYEDVIIYANGTALTPDAEGFYTLPKSDETVVITAAGAVKDDSAPGGKLSFWELLIRFFKKIIDFFSGAFAK